MASLTAMDFCRDFNKDASILLQQDNILVNFSYTDKQDALL